MSDIDNQQVVRFSNDRVRGIADKIVQLQYALMAFQSDYVSQGIAAKVSAGGVANNVADGYNVDGRPAVTGTAIVNLKAAVDQIYTAIAATNVTGVGSPPSTIAGAIQSNGSPR